MYLNKENNIHKTIIDKYRVAAQRNITNYPIRAKIVLIASLKSLKNIILNIEILMLLDLNIRDDLLIALQFIFLRIII